MIDEKYPDGTKLNVTFTYGNSVTSNMTLRVLQVSGDSNGEAVSGEEGAKIGAGESLDFIYDAKWTSDGGTNGRWVLVGYGNLSTTRSQI
jgi:hypothetical protein